MPGSRFCIIELHSLDCEVILHRCLTVTSGLSANPAITKIIMKRGSKYPVQVIPGSGKEQFTVLAFANASGIPYPPFVVFTGKNLHDVWMAGGPKDPLYGTLENGWMDTNLLASWFKQGFLEWTADLPSPLLLIYDGHHHHTTPQPFYGPSPGPPK